MRYDTLVLKEEFLIPTRKRLYLSLVKIIHKVPISANARVFEVKLWVMRGVSIIKTRGALHDYSSLRKSQFTYYRLHVNYWPHASLNGIVSTQQQSNNVNTLLANGLSVAFRVVSACICNEHEFY